MQRRSPYSKYLTNFVLCFFFIVKIVWITCAKDFKETNCEGWVLYLPTSVYTELLDWHPFLKLRRFHRFQKWLEPSVRPIRSRKPDVKMDSTDPDTGFWNDLIECNQSLLLLFLLHSMNPDRKTSNLRGVSKARDKATIKRLQMYRNFKAKRDESGKIVRPAPFQSKVPSGTVARVEPNRRWFGNVRVVC